MKNGKVLLGSALAVLAACDGDGGEPNVTEADASNSEEGFASGKDGGVQSRKEDARAGMAVEAGVDCTTAEGPCIAAAGVRDEVPFTCVALRPIEDVVRIEVGTQRWGIRCDDGLADFSVGLEFPVQPAGAIRLNSAPSVEGPLHFYVRAVSGSDGGSMTDTSGNVDSGTLTGTLRADMLATGRLSASWAAPGADCRSGETNSACAEGALELTFRVTLP